MKKSVILMLLLVSLTMAESPKPVNKAVFDCSAEDMGFILTRMKLIEQTAKDFIEAKEPYDFVLTIHSQCTPVASTESFEYVDETQVKLLKNIQTQLLRLMNEYKVDIRVCRIALNAHGLDPKTLLPNINTTKNSFLDVIRLQNSGYALFPLIK